MPSPDDNGPMKLRDYQSRTLRAIGSSTARSVLVVAPTGAGKGTMAAELILRASMRRKRVAFVVHRREILRDMRARLEALGAGKVGDSLRSDDRRIVVVSVQGAMRETAGMPFDLLVLDEAHHYAASEWAALIKRIQPGKIVGWTATPQRPDGRSLGDMFETLYESISYSDLLSRGLICPCRVLRPRQKTSVNELAQDPVEALLRYGRNESTLVFVGRVDIAQNVVSRLREFGTPADLITARTAKGQRDAIMQAFAAGELRVVVNVECLTEGVDVPHVSCIVLARPTTHASTYLQIVGRVLRASPGKREATLIDLVGATHRHGLPAADRVYTLGGHGIAERPSARTRPLLVNDNADGLDVLDVELEEIAADRNIPPAGRLTAKRLRPAAGLETGRRPTNPKSGSKYAPKTTTAAPMEVSPGFIYEDRSFWCLRWREFGITQRLGLCTTDKATAEASLEVFRTEGPAALRNVVRLRRRSRRGSVYQHRGSWLAAMWNDYRTGRVKVALHCNTREEAIELLGMLAEGGDKREHARAIIEKNRLRRGVTFGPKPSKQLEDGHP